MISAQAMTLGDACNIISGGTPKRSNSDYWSDGVIPWVKIGDMSGKYISQTIECITQKGLEGSSAKLLEPGAVLYSIFASLGAVSILKIPACTNQAIAALVPKIDDLSIDYLYHWLKSQETVTKSASRGVAQSNINLSILKAMTLPLPTLDIQHEIVGDFECVLALRALAEKQMVKLDELVKSRFIYWGVVS